MIDALFVLLLAALCAATAGFVMVCDRMLGSDEEALGAQSPAATPAGEAPRVAS